ncbi:YtxH domain-containing protein [Ornithinibacillus salinisoli]|uniref:YtxH domain-containing protein n=1 Tax=Ornithinibacillus salinisoli TaxID=1848459 RepID=A0ABW4W4E7_9BACI
MGDNINSKDFLIGTLIGGAVGASLALLFAPKSGKELRGDINQGAINARHRADEWRDNVQVKGSEWKDKAYVKGSEWKQKAMDSSSQLSKVVSEKTQDFTKNVQGKLQENKSKEDEALDAVNEVSEAIDDATEKLNKQ